MGPNAASARSTSEASSASALTSSAPAFGLGQRRLDQEPGRVPGGVVHDDAPVEWHEPAEGDQRKADARLRILAGPERVRDVGEDRGRAEPGHDVGFPAAMGMPVSTPRMSLNGARSETSTPCGPMVIPRTSVSTSTPRALMTEIARSRRPPSST